jgi:ribonucleoside-diphosphate reductase alpha chain
MKNVAIATNAEFADALSINASVAISCIKPEGTVSQLTNTASGIHPQHSEYFIRRVRSDNKDPLTDFLKAQGFPSEPCVMKPDSTPVFSFPMKVDKGAILREGLTAVEHLKLWLLYQRHWCEHKPSVTISVRDHEWVEVGAWVFKNFDICSGISFLPHSDHIYDQAPYQECTKEEYEALAVKMPPSVEWSRISQYENQDNTTGSQQLACTAGVCEVVDLVQG